MAGRKYGWVALVVSVMIILMMPGSSFSQPKSVLRVGWGVDAVTLDPAYQADFRSGSVISHIMETLVVLDPKDLSVQPGLAEKWKVIDDKTYQFQLRKNVTFHDGSPFNAEAVKYSIERFISPETKSPRASYLNMIDQMKVLDPNTLQVSLKYPFGPFLQQLAYFGSVIVSPKSAKEYGLKEFGNHPSGTGPFKLQDWKRGEQITLVRNEKYWGKQAGVREIRFKVIPDEATRVIALETGDIDLAVDVPTHEADRLQSKPGIQVVTGESLRTVFMALNTRVKPLDDVRVRKAIDLAIDEEAMINALMGKYGRVPTSVMNPLIFGGKKYPPKKADLKKAKELLAQAGYPNGFASKLYTPQGRYPKDKEMATLISAQLEQIGIKAPVEVFEWATYTSKVNNRDYSMVILGWGNTTGHADVFLHPQFHSSQMKSTLNPANYNNPEVDSLLEKARKTTNPDIQREAYHKVLDILQEQAPVIPLCHPVQIFALRGNVKGFASVPTEVIVLDKVYLE